MSSHLLLYEKSRSDNLGTVFFGKNTIDDRTEPDRIEICWAEWPANGAIEKRFQHPVYHTPDLALVHVFRNILFFRKVQHVSVIELQRAGEVRIERCCCILEIPKILYHLWSFLCAFRLRSRQLNIVTHHLNGITEVEVVVALLLFPEKLLEEAALLVFPGLGEETMNFPRPGEERVEVGTRRVVRGRCMFQDPELP